MPDTPTQDAQTPAEQEAALEEKLQSKLNELDDEKDLLEDEPEGDEEEQEELDDPGDESGDEGGDDPDAGDDLDESDEDDAEEAAADDDTPSDAPTLSDAERRSLYAYGWKDEEIDDELAHNGTRFVNTAQKLHTKRNEELQNWAAAGRQAREDDSDAGDPPAQPETKAPTPTEVKVDVEALKKEYGEDDPLVQAVVQQNAALAEFQKMLPQLQSAQQTVSDAEYEQTKQAVEGFFSDKSLQPYEGLYGPAKGQLSDEHVATRNRLLDTAFDLIMGAKQVRGENLNLQEGLELAHQIVSKDFSETVVRNGLKKKAKQRRQGISLKPSSRSSKSTAQSGPPKDEAELAKRTKQRLRAVFG